MSLSFTGGLDETVWNDSAAHSKSTTITANLKIKYNVSVYRYPRAHAWKISMIILWDNSVLACKGIVTVIWWYNDNNDNNNNNGNFICVFKCTIVNLATYRQFTNAAWDWIIYKKKKQTNKQTKTKTKTKQKPEKKISKLN